MAKPIIQEAHLFDSIGNGTQIIGDIITDSDIKINGILKGNLTGKGRVLIGATGKITGEIRCKNADISGALEGKLFVSELLSFKASGKFRGEAVYGKLEVEAGAELNGMFKMDGQPIGNLANDKK